MSRHAFFAYLLLAIASHAAELAAWPTPAIRARIATTVRYDPEAQALWQEACPGADAALVAAPQPAAQLHFEGLLETEPVRVETTRRLADRARLIALLSGWCATSNEKYAATAKAYVLAWARTYLPTGNPINEVKLDAVLIAALALRERFAPGERIALNSWTRQLVEAGDGAMAARPNAARGNWLPKHLKVVALAAEFHGDAARLAEVRRAFCDYVDRSLRSDGSSYDFEYRDALHYHLSGLPSMLCLAAQLDPTLYRHGAAGGGSLQQAIAFVLPYARGEKTHREFGHSRAGIDRRRAAAGLVEYQPGHKFDPRQALPTFTLAIAFEPATYTVEVARLAERTHQRHASWHAVLVHSGWVLEDGAL